MGNEDESVACVALDVAVDLGSDLGGATHELLAGSHFDDEFTDAEVFGLGLARH